MTFCRKCFTSDKRLFTVFINKKYTVLCATCFEWKITPPKPIKPTK